MNELQIFNSEEFGEVRTVEIDGKPYFVHQQKQRFFEKKGGELKC